MLLMMIKLIILELIGSVCYDYDNDDDSDCWS